MSDDSGSGFHGDGSAGARVPGSDHPDSSKTNKNVVLLALITQECRPERDSCRRPPDALGGLCLLELAFSHVGESPRRLAFLLNRLRPATGICHDALEASARSG